MASMRQAGGNGKADLPQPADDEVILEVTSKPDNFGRQHFSAFWMADNVGPSCNERGVRGQNFHAVVAEHAVRWEACGLRVTVVEAVTA
jgi:hypothetical protein